jgi:hypothetical protein
MMTRRGAQFASPGHTNPWVCNGLLTMLVRGHVTHKVRPIQAPAQGQGAIPCLP